MQVTWFIQLVGGILLIGGIILVVIALVSTLLNSDSDEEKSTQSRGIILIGPIPIVWGYGRRGWIIAGVIGAAIFLLWLLIFL